MSRKVISWILMFAMIVGLIGIIPAGAEDNGEGYDYLRNYIQENGYTESSGVYSFKPEEYSNTNSDTGTSSEVIFRYNANKNAIDLVYNSTGSNHTASHTIEIPGNCSGNYYGSMTYQTASTTEVGSFRVNAATYQHDTSLTMTLVSGKGNYTSFMELSYPTALDMMLYAVGTYLAKGGYSYKDIGFLKFPDGNTGSNYGKVVATNSYDGNMKWTLYDSGIVVFSGTGIVKGVYSGVYKYKNDITEVIIEEGPRSIDDQCFFGYSYIERVTLPSTLTRIGDRVFWEAINLTEITIPESVEHIGERAFYKCSALTSATVLGPVTKIFKSTFGYCENLESVLLPPCVTTIGESAFSHCSNLQKINLPDTLTMIEKDAFSSCSSLPEAIIPNGVKTVGQGAFYKCVSMKKAVIPSSVTTLGEEAFAYDSSLEEVEIQSGIKKIANTTFFHCTSLNKIEIPDSVTTIDSDAFSGCDNLTEITLPRSVISINGFVTIPRGKKLTIYGYSNSYAESFAESNYNTFVALDAPAPSPSPVPSTNPSPSPSPSPVPSEEPTPSPSPSASPTINFRDVPPGEYYAEPVFWAVLNGITDGVDEGLFGPDRTCTRAQIVTFLWRAKGSPKATGNNPFKDVKQDDYFYDAVLWAVANGITSGTADDAFSPSDPCTRAQVVTFLWRTEGQPKGGKAGQFSDVPAGQYFTDAVAWAVDKGITDGVDIGKFGPDQACTRGQIVTFLYRDMA